MPAARKDVDTLTHEGETRTHIPNAEHEPLVRDEDKAPLAVEFARRDPDLDPQLVWRGKDTEDWSDLVVQAPPLYIQEEVHPKVLIDDLMRRTEAREDEDEEQIDLFAEFDRELEGDARTEFYRHDRDWRNRMILGDSLQVMAALAEREGERGKVQCIYFDPPYGIRFNSNFQWSTTSRDVTDGKSEHITREPEQVKAFRDTWRDGIHSYLTYLRDRLTVCRDLLHETGSIFVQIGDENVHRVRALMDETFGEDCYVNTIVFKKKSSTLVTESVFDTLLWYCRTAGKVKTRELYEAKAEPEELSKYNTLMKDDMVPHRITALSQDEIDALLADGAKWTRVNYPIVSQHPSKTRSDDYLFQGEPKTCGRNKQWRYDLEHGMPRIEKASRLFDGGGESLGGVVFYEDWNQVAIPNIWADMHGEKHPTYVVQTATAPLQRCILMTTDPGDLVLDPTCGSGTAAAVAEQWGRRWITIDTSRVALALARARLMGARYPYYFLKDSFEGRQKIADVTRKPAKTGPTGGDVRQGFVYERAARVKLREIAHNAEIDVIYDRFREDLDPIHDEINAKLAAHSSTLARDQSPLAEWQMPREPGTPWPEAAQKQHARFLTVKTEATKQKAVNEINKVLSRSYTLDTLPEHPVDPWEDAELIDLHRQWWALRIARQKEIDASIAAAADYEPLYDRPYEDKGRVRVAGPFTVESISPHRTLGVDEDGNPVDAVAEAREGYGGQDFPSLILGALRKAGVQQIHKDDRITFDALTEWPGAYVAAEGVYTEAETGTSRRAAVFIGPEFGTVSRADLVAAAREASDAGFDVLIACAFSFEAHATGFQKLGAVQVLQARMNADLHMAADLADTGAGNLFVIFGEPDIEILPADDGQVQVQIRGVDVFDPSTGEVRSDDTDGIACWFIDTDYNEESFFVRHAYFLGAGDPYKSLKTTLKAEIDEEAWESLYSDTSRPFTPPASGRIAVKVINHLGDEVMRVFRVDRQPEA